MTTRNDPRGPRERERTAARSRDVGSYERSFWSEPSGGHQRHDAPGDIRDRMYGRGGYGWSGPDTVARGDLRPQHRGRGPRVFRSDDRVREDVCERLTDDPYLDASNVEVQVHDDEVTLSGTVRSRQDKRRAEMLAERIRGVRDVHNRLRLE